MEAFIEDFVCLSLSFAVFAFNAFVCPPICNDINIPCIGYHLPANAE